ncbi:hypothetical protein ACRRTK_020769 [Alexandromys fortis]
MLRSAARATSAPRASPPARLSPPSSQARPPLGAAREETKCSGRETRVRGVHPLGLRAAPASSRARRRVCVCAYKERLAGDRPLRGPPASLFVR